jgi:hypothetical protein
MASCFCGGSDDLYSTIEVMYISLRRSQHALYALSFFIMMVLTIFSTLLLVIALSLESSANARVDTLPNEGHGMRTLAFSLIRMVTLVNSR